MLTQLTAYFSRLFNSQGSATYGSALEQYIVSKNPTNAAEIDHWTRQFDRNQSHKGWTL